MRLFATRAPRCAPPAALLFVLLLLAARPAGAGTLTLAWDRSPSASVIGYVVYVGTSSGLYTEAFDVGAATSFVFTAGLSNTVYYFAVASYAAGPVVGPPSAEVAAAMNGAPSLVAPGDQTSRVGESVSLALRATDPEGDPLTFSAKGLPAGLSLDTRVGVIFGAGTTAGKYTVTASVTDGEYSASRSFAWTISSSPLSAPTQVSPSGPINGTKPTFVWNAVPNATIYRLWVDDAYNGTARILKDYTPSQLGCASGTGRCYASPGVTLAPGNATWWVMASNATSSSSWSAGLKFVVPSVP